MTWTTKLFRDEEAWNRIETMQEEIKQKDAYIQSLLDKIEEWRSSYNTLWCKYQDLQLKVDQQ